MRLRKALGEMFPKPAFLGTDTIAVVDISNMENRPRGVCCVICTVAYSRGCNVWPRLPYTTVFITYHTPMEWISQSTSPKTREKGGGGTRNETDVVWKRLGRRNSFIGASLGVLIWIGTLHGLFKLPPRTNYQESWFPPKKRGRVELAREMRSCLMETSRRGISTITFFFQTQRSLSFVCIPP